MYAQCDSIEPISNLIKILLEGIQGGQSIEFKVDLKTNVLDKASNEIHNKLYTLSIVKNYFGTK
jgi:hypothetical protein